MKQVYSQSCMTIGYSSLSGNTQLVCDCHLQWLPAFIASHSSQPRVALDGVLCAFPSNTLITDANYTATACEGKHALTNDACKVNAFPCMQTFVPWGTTAAQNRPLAVWLATPQCVPALMATVEMV